MESNNRHLIYFLNESNLDISSKTLIQIKTLTLKAYQCLFLFLLLFFFNEKIIVYLH